jgi:hypothetical protein
MDSDQPNPCSQVFCKEYDTIDLPGVIDGALLNTLSKDYNEDLNKSNISGTGNKDGLSMVFDIEKLKNLIWHIQKAACTANCDSKMELGVRFYYIKYPATLGTEQAPAGLRGTDGLQVINQNQHALAMVGVYRFPNGEWYDFDFNNLFSACSGLTGGVSDTVGTVAILGEGSNHGGVGPPPFPGTYPTNPL